MQLRAGGVRLGVRPADDRVRDFGRQSLLELGASLVAADDDDAGPAESPVPVLDLLDHRLVVVVLQLLDVPLVPRLRPPALVVAAGCVLRAVRDLLEPAAAKLEHTSLLAADRSDDHAVPASEQRHERRDQEVVRDARGVGHRGREREHAPDVVRPGREHGQPAGAVPVELAVEVLVEPLEVFLQPALDLVREIGARRAVRLRRDVEERTDARRDSAGSSETTLGSRST